jgi:hypothetical protein
LWESQKETDYYKNEDLGGWIILKWNLERYDGMVWTDQPQEWTSGGLL